MVALTDQQNDFCDIRASELHAILNRLYQPYCSFILSRCPWLDRSSTIAFGSPGFRGRHCALPYVAHRFLSCGQCGLIPDQVSKISISAACPTSPEKCSTWSRKISEFYLSLSLFDWRLLIGCMGFPSHSIRKADPEPVSSNPWKTRLPNPSFNQGS